MYLSGPGTLCSETIHTRSPGKIYIKTKHGIQKTENRKHSGNRTYDRIFSRSASYLLTTRCCLHTWCLTKIRKTIPRLHRLHINHRCVYFYTKTKKKEISQEINASSRTRTTDDLLNRTATQGFIYSLCSYMKIIRMICICTYE